MPTFTKVKLSGSTDGKGVLVAQTATAGTTIHTAGSGTVNWDEIWLYAVNEHTADLVLTIEYGSAGVEDNMTVTVPSKSGLQLIIPGLLLQNSAILKAFAASANKITLHGFVNRITA